MSDNLYFMADITAALHQPDIEKVLRDAFVRIKKKGDQERYAEGFNNFKVFMDEVYSQHDLVVTDYIRQLIVELASGTFEGTVQEIKALLDIINSHPEWKAEYEAFCRMEAHEDLTQVFPVIAVLSEKGLVREITFTKVPSCESVGDILPGKYVIKLANTGWTIWEGKLTAEELILPEGENLSLAAGVGAPTKKIDLLNNGEVILRTYAGIESGCVEIELTR